MFTRGIIIGSNNYWGDERAHIKCKNAMGEYQVQKKRKSFLTFVEHYMMVKWCHIHIHILYPQTVHYHEMRSCYSIVERMFKISVTPFLHSVCPEKMLSLSLSVHNPSTFLLFERSCCCLCEACPRLLAAALPCSSPQREVSGMLYCRGLRWEHATPFSFCFSFLSLSLYLFLSLFLSLSLPLSLTHTLSLSLFISLSHSLSHSLFLSTSLLIWYS